MLTGPPGAGKTSVLTALVDSLTDDDIAHVAIELETLAWTHPALSDELWSRHIKATCGLYREAGHSILLVAETIETDDDLDQLLDALDADGHYLVRLEAPPATLAQRIIDREPASWSGLDDLVEHAQELAASMPGLAAVDLVVSTEGQRPEAVAARIRAGLPDAFVVPGSARSWS